MSDNYNREDLDEEVNKVMEDNTEQDLSTVNDSELTTDTEADNNKGEKEKAAKNKKEPKPKKEKKPKTKECKESDKQASTEETSGEVIEESTAGEDIKTKVKDKCLKRKERRDKKKMEILDNLIGEEKAEEVIEKVKEAKKEYHLCSVSLYVRFFLLHLCLPFHFFSQGISLKRLLKRTEQPLYRQLLRQLRVHMFTDMKANIWWTVREPFSKERQDLQVIIPCLIHLRKRQELNQPFTMAMKSK